MTSCECMEASYGENMYTAIDKNKIIQKHKDNTLKCSCLKTLNKNFNKCNSDEHHCKCRHDKSFFNQKCLAKIHACNCFFDAIKCRKSRCKALTHLCCCIWIKKNSIAKCFAGENYHCCTCNENLPSHLQFDREKCTFKHTIDDLDIMISTLSIDDIKAYMTAVNCWKNNNYLRYQLCQKHGILYFGDNERNTFKPCQYSFFD